MAKSTSQPFGDIYQVGTPYLDKLSNQIYADQKQRELYQQQQNKALDDEFARNMSGIRDADIGDLTKAYGDFKMANQQLSKLGGNAKPEQQLDVLRKKAAVYDIINNSKNQRQNLETPLQQGLLKDKNKYQDDAHARLLETMKTPYSKLTDEQKNPDTYTYTPTVDFSKDMNNAWGKKQNAIVDVTPKGAIQKTQNVYSRFNDPYSAYTNLVSSLQDEKKRNDFIKTHTFTPDQEQAITERYYNIVNDPTYQKIHGLSGNETFMGGDTELGKAAKLAVMMSTPKPVLENIKTPTDVEAKSNATNTEWDRRNAVTSKQAMNRLYVHAGIERSKNTLVAEDAFQSQMKYAKEHNGEFMPLEKDIDNLQTKELGITTRPDKFILNPDGETITYFKDGSPLGTITTGTYFKAMVPAGTKTTANIITKQKPTPTTIHAATRAEWKASGWTDAQINEGIKSKKIIVKQ